jgi:IS30 family transposase
VILQKDFNSKLGITIMKINTSKTYCHLNINDRENIGLLLANNQSKRVIAQKTSRHISTIYRELARNSIKKNKSIKKKTTTSNKTPDEFLYTSLNAQKLYEQRIKNSHFRPRFVNRKLKKYVIDKLKNAHWSPAAIAGRWNQTHPLAKTNYESIYQWIYNVRYDLTKFLPRQKPIRSKRAALAKRKNVVPDKTLITERPQHINNREEFGHFEADTVVAPDNRSAVAVIVERKSRMYFAVRLPEKTAQKMHEALVGVMSKLPKNSCKSITYDQGSKNAKHKLTNKVLEIKSYFCLPYHSWEKGSVENKNRSLRRFFPIGTNWSLISQEKIDTALHIINNTPMKCLNWRTPFEVFSQQLNFFALAG